VEWHVHAWDMASAIGISYRPADPAAVLAAWLAGVGWLVRRGIGDGGRLARRPALTAGALTIAGLAAWAIGLYLA